MRNAFSIALRRHPARTAIAVRLPDAFAQA